MFVSFFMHFNQGMGNDDGRYGAFFSYRGCGMPLSGRMPIRVGLSLSQHTDQ
jgi:hypothetical protein